MNQDAELAAWRRRWQAGGEPSDWEALKERVIRQTRHQKISLIAPVLVTLVVGGYLLWNAVHSAGRTDIVLAIEGWLFIVILWVISVRLARGTWQPLGQTTEAFVDLAVVRCRSNHAAARVAVWCYVGHLLVVLLLFWILGNFPAGLGEMLVSWPVIFFGWIGLPLCVAWMVWYQRRRHAELAFLIDLKRQLTDADAST